MASVQFMSALNQGYDRAAAKSHKSESENKETVCEVDVMFSSL